jgi:hypothetical protein
MKRISLSLDNTIALYYDDITNSVTVDVEEGVIDGDYQMSENLILKRLFDGKTILRLCGLNDVPVIDGIKTIPTNSFTFIDESEDKPIQRWNGKLTQGSTHGLSTIPMPPEMEGVEVIKDHSGAMWRLYANGRKFWYSGHELGTDDF